MKITKFVHSCLLIEEDRKKILIDPGNYSEEVLDLSVLSDLSYLLISHEHPDHMYLPLIKKILEKFPEVKIVSNQSAAGILGKEGITVGTNGDGFIQMEEVPHEKVFGSTPPQNVLFRINGKLTHPGDSFQFTSTTEILTLPLQAPWGSTTEAVELAERLNPKVIIPIHDWHWNDIARENMYKRLEEYFAALSIRFIGLEDGATVEV
ncbi:hypothetical protein A3B39_05110 [Candidatus Daviesbacteria bacterium RIFCSPLOWO2_01_FULL_37_10]|nr:MAG: hypothetical protein A3B39_05110 [Candidatus Daviesbacteria bacterium RIFCSPLOWO2_01_FULL_37_10]